MELAEMFFSPDLRDRMEASRINLSTFSMGFLRWRTLLVVYDRVFFNRYQGMGLVLLLHEQRIIQENLSHPRVPTLVKS